jgi:hypothetical protein
LGEVVSSKGEGGTGGVREGREDGTGTGDVELEFGSVFEKRW